MPPVSEFELVLAVDIAAAIAGFGVGPEVFR